ncbi:MAG: hypothetical protein HUK04_00455 [Bacteroidaceae bacterium]|nr:hypothetical protein [Bacteroidaceae bacterium]
MAYYDQQPSKFEAVGNGSTLYRFNIEETEAPAAAEASDDTEAAAEPRTQWECDEVTVWHPLTANKITEAVIATICPASHEQKLVNEYNAAILGLVGGGKTSDEAKVKIAAYKEFLEYRNTLKEQVDADCAEQGIK